MKTIYATLLVLASPTVIAAEFCQKKPHDPDFPAGLEGRYEIIGKDPKSGAAYSGYLAISTGKSVYGIGRVVDGTVVRGRAWIESCGSDKIAFLVAEYDTNPLTRLSCRLGADGDNYYRTTCRTGSGEQLWRGLESWFQNPDLAP